MITEVLNTEQVVITEHQSAGFRFAFQDVDNSKGTPYACAEALDSMDLDYSIDSKMMGFTFVYINSGQYKGFYDADYDYKTNELVLRQDKH